MGCIWLLKETEALVAAGLGRAISAHKVANSAANCAGRNSGTLVVLLKIKHIANH
jgi:hypothetical protein